MPDPQSALTVDRLRAIVQDAHLSFLIGAGTPSPYFALLGDIETCLTAIDQADCSANTRALARASVQAHFFERVVAPNLPLRDGDPTTNTLLHTYGDFGRALNRLLITRRNSLLSKKVNVFTTNIDLAFEIAFERLGINLIDGFAGRIRPSYDLGLLGSVHYRTGLRYDHRSEIPTFDLYKLHGSVGWHLDSGASAPTAISFDPQLADVLAAQSALNDIRDDLVPIPDSSDIDVDDLLSAAAASEPPRELAAFSALYESLVIVNPETQKFATTVLTEIYYELIRRFANALERENSLLLVHGFSFRDDHLRDLVTRSARTNPTLQVLIVCYEKSDRAAYDALIPSSQVPNGNIAYLAPTDDATRLDLATFTRSYLAPLATPIASSAEKSLRAPAFASE